MSVVSGTSKYDRKTGTMGAHWQAAVSRYGRAHWVERLTAAGAPPGPTRTAAYESGISAPESLAAYNAGVQGKGTYWATRFKEAMAL